MTPSPADMPRTTAVVPPFSAPAAAPHQVTPRPAPRRPKQSGPPQRDAALAQPGVHDCPVPDCDVLVSPGLIACREHWLKIPRHRRLRLVPTFQQRTDDPAAFDTAVRIARELVLTYARRTP